MLLKRVLPLTLFLFAVLASLIGARLLVSSRPASALPGAGEDFLTVQGSVNASSRIGQETALVLGTATIRRDAPRMEGGVEVQDLVISSLELEGQSVTGPIHVGLNPAQPSTGQLRSLSPSSEFPASSFFDVFFEVEVPASPSGTNPITLRNLAAVRIAPEGGGDVDVWPPIGVTYRADLVPCLPLAPALPAEVCVHSLVVTLSEGAPENPTYSVAPGGPSEIHPASLLSLAPPPAPTATPTSTQTPNLNITPTPTHTPIPAPSNDDFADATTIGALPFSADQTTVGATVETGEPISPACLGLLGAKGHTVWFRYMAPASGSVHVSTLNSQFDTVLAAYTGSAVNALTLVACDDDKPTPPGLHSEITFDVTSGTTYYLQAGGYDTSTGDLHLKVSIAGGGGLAFQPSVRISCGALGLSMDGCDDGGDGDQDDVDGLSYGADFGEHPQEEFAFSVAPGSTGLAGTGVAAQAACSPAEPQADEFVSTLNGTNALLFDGDGAVGPCPPGHALGLMELPQSDDLDVLVDQPPSFVDTDINGIPERPVLFSLAPDSPSLVAILAGPADVLFTQHGATPLIFASAASLGLVAGDDIDALCVKDDGIGFVFTPGTDEMLFSLAAGSPSLATIGASAADVLEPGPTVAVEAAALGLRDEDDLDALKCFSASGTPPTPTRTLTPTPSPNNGDVNKDGNTNSIDASIVLQHAAGLVGTINARADVNEDGRVNAVDATLILQFDARLIPMLPV